MGRFALCSKQSNDLVEKCEQLLLDPARAETLGEAAQAEFHRRFSKEASISKMEELVEGLLI